MITEVDELGEGIPGLKVEMFEETTVAANATGDEISRSEGSGKLAVSNAGEKDRIWSIDMFLENLDSVLESNPELTDHVVIGELAPGDAWVSEYKFKTEKPKLLVKQEFLDEETNETPVFVKGEETRFIYRLTIKNDSDAILEDILINKELTSGTNVVSRNANGGDTSVEEGLLKWNVPKMEPGEELYLECTFTVTLEDVNYYETGKLDVTYRVNGSLESGIGFKDIDGLSNNFMAIYKEEREDEPDVWDVKLIVKNRSEFDLLLKHIVVMEVKPDGSEETLAEIDYSEKSIEERLLHPNEENQIDCGVVKTAEEIDLETLFESETGEVGGEPAIKFKADFSILHDLELASQTNMELASEKLLYMAIRASKEYSTTSIPSYRKTLIHTTLMAENTGSRDLEIVTVKEKIPADFLPPPVNKIKVYRNDVEIPNELISITVEPEDNDPKSDHELVITIDNIQETEEGPLKEGEIIKVEYPLLAYSPRPDVGQYIVESIVEGNVHPPLKPVVATIEEPIPIEVVHLRRKVLVGKEVSAREVAELNEYRIIIRGQNMGNAPLTDVEILDIIPTGFVLHGETEEVPAVEMERHAETPEGVILRWQFDKLEPGQEFTITYTIRGEGEYNPRDVQTFVKG